MAKQKECRFKSSLLFMGLLLPLLLSSVQLIQQVQAWSSSVNDNVFHRRRRPVCLRMAAVEGVESTPNPSSFLLRLSEPLQGMDGVVSHLRGKTFTKHHSSPDLPADERVKAVLQTDGVESVYAMLQTITVNKHPTAQWEQVLPRVMQALGGSSSDNLLLEILSSPNESSVSSSLAGQVRIRMQVSNGLPIQLEAIGYRGSKQRAKLPCKFQDAMQTLMKNDDKDYFASRKWLDRGVRYPDVATTTLEEERENLEIQQALQMELDEVDAAYSTTRIADILSGENQTKETPVAMDAVENIDLEAVDRLCDLAEMSLGKNNNEALETLARFVMGGKGQRAARRNAIAYLGGAGDSDSSRDLVFHALEAALQNEASPVLRRTAGDAMSDLGDPRAVPVAVQALLKDRSKLVRWRAARVLGELADTNETAAILKQASLEEEAFEVAFELKDALRKVQARVHGGDAAPNVGPVWKQIQEGAVGDG